MADEFDINNFCKVELETKSMFIRYISHEIRNPLHSVLLGLENMEEDLRRGRDKSSVIETLRDVKDSLQVSMNTLNDMLTSDKIRSGLLVAERREVQLISFLSAVILRYQSQVECMLLFACRLR